MHKDVVCERNEEKHYFVYMSPIYSIFNVSH